MSKSKLKMSHKVVTSYLKDLNNFKVPMEIFNISEVKVNTSDEAVYYNAIMSTDDSAVSIICQCVMNDCRMEMIGALDYHNSNVSYLDGVYSMKPRSILPFIITAEVKGNNLIVDSVNNGNKDTVVLPVEDNYSIKMGLNANNGESSKLSYK